MSSIVQVLSMVRYPKHGPNCTSIPLRERRFPVSLDLIPNTGYRMRGPIKSRPTPISSDNVPDRRRRTEHALKEPRQKEKKLIRRFYQLRRRNARAPEDSGILEVLRDFDQSVTAQTSSGPSLSAKSIKFSPTKVTRWLSGSVMEQFFRFPFASWFRSSRGVSLGQIDRIFTYESHAVIVEGSSWRGSA
jgi:hypothetical protein